MAAYTYTKVPYGKAADEKALGEHVCDCTCTCERCGNKPARQTVLHVALMTLTMFIVFLAISVLTGFYDVFAIYSLLVSAPCARTVILVIEFHRNAATCMILGLLNILLDSLERVYRRSVCPAHYTTSNTPLLCQVGILGLGLTVGIVLPVAHTAIGVLLYAANDIILPCAGA